MKPSFTTFALFIVAQLVLLVVSGKAHIATGGEILIETIAVGVFIALFFAGYRWARWVAAILLGFIGLLVGNMTFEGFGFGFLSVAFLYGAVIVVLFKHSPTSRPAEPVGLGAEVIDWLSTPETAPAAAGNTFYMGEESYQYPVLVKRYQSLLIDFVVLFGIMIVTMVILGESQVRQTVMVSLGVVFALLYEPVLTAYGTTLGQYIIGIRVRDAKNPEERINILQAYVRIIIKWLLGWLSFVTINFNPQHRAIHDLVGSSVVIKVK